MSRLLKYFISICLLFTAFKSFAQKDSLRKFSFSGYSEFYYSYDFSNPDQHEKPDYNYNYKKHDQLNVNLAFVKASYQSKGFRSNMALMKGTYATYNLSSEPKWVRTIFEANIGIKLSQKNELWLDAGVMPSHIGFESAIGGDCFNLTRSILAENSPYYETGIKLNYTNKKQTLLFAALLLNGWQKISFSNWSGTPSIGLQFNYKPNTALTLNYSNFIGNTGLDSLGDFRLFHNLFAIYEASKKVSFIIGFDIGTQKEKGERSELWCSPIFISKLKLNSKNSLAGRLEYYSDRGQVIIPTGTANGYKTIGASVNYDFQMTSNLLWRAEYKIYKSKDAIFKYEQPGRINKTATVALVCRF